MESKHYDEILSRFLRRPQRCRRNLELGHPVEVEAELGTLDSTEAA